MNWLHTSILLEIVSLQRLLIWQTFDMCLAMTIVQSMFGCCVRRVGSCLDVMLLYSLISRYFKPWCESDFNTLNRKTVVVGLCFFRTLQDHTYLTDWTNNEFWSDSRTRRHWWIEFVFGFLLVPRVFPRVLGFLSLQSTEMNIVKLHATCWARNCVTGRDKIKLAVSRYRPLPQWTRSDHNVADW